VLAGVRGFNGFSQSFCSGLACVWLSKRHWQIVKARQFVGLLQTLVTVALFFVASLNSFTGSGWLAVSQLAGVVFNKSSLPLFGFASAASRESPVQAANKQSQPTRTAQLL
jgi:hypothetical protein